MANRMGRAAKRISRRCFTRVNVTTPTAPRTPLPTKFAVAEKHIGPSSPLANLTRVVAGTPKHFLRCSDSHLQGVRPEIGMAREGIGSLRGIPPLPRFV